MLDFFLRRPHLKADIIVILKAYVSITCLHSNVYFSTERKILCCSCSNRLLLIVVYFNLPRFFFVVRKNYLILLGVFRDCPLLFEILFPALVKKSFLLENNYKSYKLTNFKSKFIHSIHPYANKLT